MVELQDGEEFLPIPGWDGLYSVSNLGRVRRDAGGQGAKAGRILRPGRIDRSGHLAVVLYRDGERSTMLVHRLVVAAFVGECPEGMEVRHLDGNPANNVLRNLEYGTQSENALDAHRYGGCITGQKLTLAQVAEIRKRLDAGESQTSIARRFGVVQQTISKIKTSSTWAHRLDESLAKAS